MFASCPFDILGIIAIITVIILLVVQEKKHKEKIRVLKAMNSIDK